MTERALRLFSAAGDQIIERGWLDYFDGWVLTPLYGRWSHRIAPWVMPTIIDNGAWTDFMQGRSRSAPELLERTVALAARARGDGLPVEFCVLPDAVGDWNRTAEMLWAIERPRIAARWAMPLQDGFDPGEVRRLVEHLSPEVLFIGGSGMPFKREAVAFAQSLGLPIHVGRVHRVRDLSEMARTEGVVSVDTSAFCRPHAAQSRTDALGRRLVAFRAYLDGSQSGLDDWGVA